MLGIRSITSHVTRRPMAQQLLRQFSTDTKLIINAVGQDRLGIVADITGKVIQSGGNVGESQAAKLGSHFSLMMLVDIPVHKLDDLRATLAALPDMNASVFEAPELQETFTPKVAYSGYFELEGADNPGIVHTVTSALAEHGLSIEKMSTDQEIAPHGGTVLFRMRGVANAYEPLPRRFDIVKIRDELRALGDSLNCDCTMEDAVDDSASGVFYAG